MMSGSYIQRNPNSVTFRIPGLTKTRRSGPPRSLTVTRFEDGKICPVNALEHYLEHTQHLRESNGRNSLLPSFQKPHKAVTSTAIAMWLKEVLSQAGVQTGTFSAHSTWSASATAARGRGYQSRT